MTTTNMAMARPRIPVYAYFELTNACNLRCLHCAVCSGLARQEELSTSEWLDVADQLYSSGCRRVRLSGGEPLLRPDLPVIAARLVRAGVKTEIVTNGSLLDEDAVRRLADVGVDTVLVSIDGEREVHDRLRQPSSTVHGSRYDLAMAAISRLARSTMACHAITQIHRHNLESLPAIYEALVQAGVVSWQVQLARPQGRLLELTSEYLLEPARLPRLAEILVDLIRSRKMRIVVSDNIGYYGRFEPILRGAGYDRPRVWTGCLSGCRVVAVDPEGNVRGCPSHPPSFGVGNIRSESFAAIWADEERFAYNTRFDVDQLAGGCARCAYRRTCRGGCKSMAFAVTATVHDNPFCLQRADQEMAR